MPRDTPQAVGARAEVFGAIVRLSEPPALVAVDRARARSLGVEGDALWAAPNPGPDVRRYEGPLEAHLAVTARCPVGCTGCYVSATPTGEHVATEDLCARLDALHRVGTFRVALGGGEAILHPDLGAVLAHGAALGLEMTVTTSGVGLTDARIDELRSAAQVNVSHDGLAGDYARVRGVDLRDAAEDAIRRLVVAGVRVGVNAVLTRQNFAGLDALYDAAHAWGAGELQLLRYKPGGRANLDYFARRLTGEQVAALPGQLDAWARRGLLRVRIDCSMVPFLAADGRSDAAAMARFGVQGCEAARALVTVDTAGASRPCSFWSAPTGEGSGHGPVDQAWQASPELERARDYPRKPPEPCRSCPVQRVCRGGCRVVAAHVSGTAWAPDPECPRVVAFVRQSKERTALT